MESLKPLLDAVPSELIVVDTVGEENSDGSLAIAEEYADKIIHFTWCDDFAAARNAGLELAKGKWFLFLDDDEWFENIHEITEFFTMGEYLNYNSATYQIRNYKDFEGKDYGVADLSRMVRLGENTQFVGKVHEAFSEFLAPCKRFSAYVHHYGYVYVNEEKKKAHQQRNLKLLQEELQKNAKDMRYRTQMALELATFDNESALSFCEETFRLCADKKQTPEFQWQLSLVFRLYEALGAGGTYVEEVYRKFEQQFGYSKVAEHAICYQMTRIFLLQNEPVKAYLYAEKFFELLVYLEEHAEEAHKQSTADFARYRARNTYLEMLHFGAFCAWQAKQYKTAWKRFGQMPWEESGYQNEEDLWKVFAMAEETSDSETLYSIIQRCLSNDEMKLILGKMMQNPVVKQRVSQTFEEKKMGKKTEEIIVSVSLLVSNRKDTIRKCMESLKPLLDAVPSELIVVDTVGEENSDGSLVIVREYTDKIIHFPWCNDFSAARNAGLKAAKGKWFLTIDDDEWFEDITPIVKFFEEGDYKDYDRAWYYVRNYHNMAGTSYVDTLADRMCVITKETRYEGRVHEGIVPLPTKVMQIFCYAHHYGYVYTTQEALQKHSERNCTLLEIEIKETPDDARLIAQLVQEYAMVGRCQEAHELCQNWLKQHKEQAKSEQWNPFLQAILVMWLRVNIELGDMDGAWALINQIKKEYTLNETVQLAFLVEGIQIDAKRECHAEILPKVKEYFELRNYILEKGSEFVIQQVLDLKKYLDNQYVQYIIKQGIMSAVEVEQYDMAQKLLNLIPWDDEKNKPFEMMVYLVEVYGKNGVPEIFYPYAERMMKNPQMKKTFIIALEGLVRDYPERRMAVDSWLRQLSGEEKKAQASAEIMKLAVQLKQNIRSLIVAGNLATAKDLLAGLKEVVPEDEEILELEVLLR